MRKIQEIGIVVIIVAVSYLVGKSLGIGIGTATYLTLLIFYKKISS